MKSGKRVITLFITFLAVSASGCIVPNQELLQLKSDVEELKQENARLRQSYSADMESRLSGIDGKVENVGEELSVMKQVLKKRGADSLADLETIRTDFQHLKGRYEEISHISEKISAENSAFTEIAEARVASMEKRMSVIEENLSQFSDKLTSIENSALKMKEIEPESAETKLSANEIYKAGLDAIREGKTQEARRSFRQYLKSYPDGPLSNNAQFWIGESYYDEKDFERAIIEYDEVAKKYPNGIKVPAALLKQAMSFENLKDRKTAGALFKKLIKDYPDSEEAKTANKMLKKK